MKRYRLVVFLFICGLILTNLTFAIEPARMDSAHQLFYIKKEITKGALFGGQYERESLVSNSSFYSEKLYVGSAAYQVNAKVWNFLDYKQETMNLLFNVGPMVGDGTFRKNGVEGMIDADRQVYGLRGLVAANYERRYYYDQKTYTLVQVNAWGRNDIFWQNTKGNLIDTNLVSKKYSNEKVIDRLRYGINAKGAWGMGRLNPMNHYMIADYVLKNFYPRRIFSEIEKENLAGKIGIIKQRREPGVERSAAEELSEVYDFLRSNMLLEAPAFSEAEWLKGEFLPRYNGARFEIGPFFNYYNREPDFYYGGFAQFRNDRYINFGWNRNISLEANYNHYKNQDWASFIADIGYSYFPDLENKISLGVKYIPSVTVYRLDKIDPIRNNFVPYFEYFTQVNEKNRVSLSFAWKIADSDDFMVSGPEFSVSFYRSSY